MNLWHIITMLYKIFLVYLTLQIIVLIHELGHYFFARICGYKVKDINIGLGHAWFSVNLKTLTCHLRYVPLGGYVSIDNLGNHDRWLPAILTLLGGVIFNLLCALVCLSILFNIGFYTQSPTIVNQNNESIEILKINDKPVKNWFQTKQYLLKAYLTQTPISIYLSNDKKVSFKSVDIKEYLDDTWLEKKNYRLWQLNIAPVILNSNNTQLLPKDVIQKVNGQSIHNNAELKKWIQYNPNHTLSLSVLRNGKVYIIKVIPKPIFYVPNIAFGKLDINLKPQPFNDSHLIYLQYTSLSAIKTAFIFIAKSIYLQYLVIKGLILGTLNLNMLSGPIGIYNTIFASLNHGLIAYLYTLALLSIAVAMINLIPIPPTDGFHIICKSITSITHWELSDRYINLLNRISLILIFLLLVNVTLNDIHQSIIHLQRDIEKYEVKR